MLAEARVEARSGSLSRAWVACRAAARMGRSLGDGVLVAEAALVISGPSIADWGMTASRQALCLEALGMIGSEHPDMRALLSAQLAAISTAWSVAPDPAVRLDPGEAERLFLSLQAEHAGALGPAGIGTRLEAATRALTIGLGAADDHIVAWARLWRLDALQQIGLRLEFNTELLDLSTVVDRLDSPVWQWRRAAIHANLALLEDRIADVPALSAAARAAAEEAGVGEARFLDLTLRSALAERTGAGLAQVEEDVRHIIAGGPFLMQGWRARILLSLGRTEEAMAIWLALAPRIGDLPPTAVEWLVAMAGHAELAIAAGDRNAAQRLRADLLPFAHLHVAATAMAPYDGAVAFVIGRLSAFLGDRHDAKTRFSEARDRAAAMHAPWHAARAGEYLAELESGIGPLSPRETQIAHNVADGRTNRAIAETLFLSERTVEQHVRNILRKLDASNRSAIAAWMARHTP